MVSDKGLRVGGPKLVVIIDQCFSLSKGFGERLRLQHVVLSASQHLRWPQSLHLVVSITLHETPILPRCGIIVKYRDGYRFS